MSTLQSFVNRARGSDFVRHGLLVFAALMAANVLQFLFYSLVSRVVGVEQYGVLTSLFSAILLVAVGPATVIATIIAKVSADLRAVADGAKLRRLGDLVTGATAIVGLIAFGVVYLFAWPIADYLHLPTTTPVILTGIALGLAFSLPVQRGVFQGMEYFSHFAVSNVVEATAKMVAGSILGMRFGLDGVLVGLCVASCLSWGYNVAVLRRLDRQAARLTLDLRRIVVTSANVAVAVFAVNALLFYDVILVRHYLSATTAGLYGASALVGRAVYTVVAFIPTIVLPKASNRSSVGRSTKSLLAAALITGGAIVAIALTACWLQPQLIVTVLAGRRFVAASAFELPYVFALGALSLTNVVAMYKIGLHRFDFVIPLGFVAATEVFSVTLWHASILQILWVLCIGHFLALGTTLFPLSAGAKMKRRNALT